MPDDGNTLEKKPLWVSGEGGYHTYRIPALAVSAKGTVLAFCEGRRDSRSDSGKIDLLRRRSLDGGLTWGDAQAIVSEEGVTCGNPCPTVDLQTGVILLPFCKNLADGPESMICQGKAPRTVWLTRSEDDGETWSEPVEITEQVKAPSWTWYATGPCHGIQLRSGRLVAPCDHIVGKNFDRFGDPWHAHVILSDDHGATWRIGGVLGEGTNESCVVETADGSLYLNARNKHGGPKRRAFAWSRDGGETFGELGRDETLVEPNCQAGITRLNPVGEGDEDGVLFSNPASEERRNLTVRLSRDGCRTWPHAKALHAGPSAYSDLAVAPAGEILCLYECGEESAYETLMPARLVREQLA